MGQKLRRSSINKILLFTAFLLGMTFQAGYSQTTLSPGDLVIVTVNVDKNGDGNKTFDFIPLVDLEPGTEINFTDAAYIGSSNSLADNEGTITFTAPQKVTAGSVITYAGEDEGTKGFQRSGRFDPSTTGDNIIVYQGSKNEPIFLYGVGWARGDTVWEYNPDSSPNNRSDIPPDLSQEENTILSLGTSDNYQYESGNGIKGSAQTLLGFVGDESSWNEDDNNHFNSFPTNFTLVDPPTIAFSETSLTVSEGGSAALTVELVEAGGTAVGVDIVFLGSSSTAKSGDDFNNFSTETINFDSEASDGDTETVSINITDNNDFESSKKAVFQLQNNTEGTIIEPRELTLTIEDADTPDVVINELLPNPGNTDIDGNGNTGSTADEFVEIVNTTDTDIDISGWTFADNESSDADKTFPEGTIIPSGGALVLFNRDTDYGLPTGYFGGAQIQISENSLSLNNSGDEPTLFDAEGNIVDQVSYSSSTSGVSLTRDGEEFVNHSEISSSDYSPGTKADGTPFGAKHAIGIRGMEGWRMMSSPVQNATFDDFFGDLWMQGASGSDDPNGDFTLMRWDENEDSFVPVDNMDDDFVPGKGYLVYVFEDDEYSMPGIQGGFPKIINTDKDENETTVQVPVSAADEDGSGSIDGNEGWNLLGNPFGTDISASAVYDALESEDGSANTNIYVWDHRGNGNWKLLDGTGDDTIAPFQAFFVRYDSEMSGTVTFEKSSLAANTGTEFYKTGSEKEAELNMELHGEEFFDTYSLEFSENGTTKLDRYDAYKLFSLNPNSINLFSNHSNNRLQKNVLPIDLETAIEIPLAFEANGRSSLTFRWDNNLQDIPSEWDLILIDKETGHEVDLRRDKEYSFSIKNDGEQQKASTANRNKLLNKVDDTQDSRFTLSVQPNIQSGISNDLPETVKLKPNYPNPFNPTTTIPYELTEESDVLLTVWNMIGQKVETLVDGTVEAGTHEVSWNASNMPSGMYIARFEVNGTVFTRKMTLIK